MSEPSSTTGEPRDVVRDVSRGASRDVSGGASAAPSREGSRNVPRGVSVAPSRDADAVAPLFSFEARWVDLMCTAIVPEPPRGTVPLAITSLHPSRFYARLCREARWDHSLTLRAALWVTALLAPLVVLGRLRTLGGLRVEQREDVLSGMHASPHYLFRQLVFLLKAQAAQVFASHDVVRALVTGQARRSATGAAGVAATTRPALAVGEALVQLRRGPQAETKDALVERRVAKERHESAA